MHDHDDPRSRTLHIIDLENLAGSPRATPDDVHATLESYCRAVAVRADDHAVLAMNANNGAMAFAARDEWRRLTGCNCVIKVGHGEDGADDALLHACDLDRIANRYGRVVIGSGDHTFECLVVELNRRGLLTGVVSRASSLSVALARRAPVHRLLDLPPRDHGGDRPTTLPSPPGMPGESARSTAWVSARPMGPRRRSRPAARSAHRRSLRRRVAQASRVRQH